MSKPESLLWSAPRHPDWLSAMNREGSYLNLCAVVPLDEDSLLQHACQATGLEDFGEDLEDFFRANETSPLVLCH